MVESSLCHVHNAWRVPDWKWQRAVQVVNGQGLPPTLRRDGVSAGIIRQLVRFRQAQVRIETLGPAEVPLATERLMEEFPLIYWAHFLYSTAERKSARWAVEARILAQETDLQIAATNRSPREVVAMYAAVFFDVRADLDRTEFILHSVFGDDLYGGLEGRDYGIMWKLLGYFGGPDVIDAMTRRMISPTRTRGAAGVPQFFRQVVFGVLKERAAIAGLTAQVNSHSNLPLIGAFAEYLQLEQATEAEASESNQILGNVSSMLSIVRKSFQVGSTAGALKSSPFGEALEQGAVELGCDQMLRMANGYPVDNLEELANLKYPEPTN